MDRWVQTERLFRNLGSIILRLSIVRMVIKSRFDSNVLSWEMNPGTLILPPPSFPFRNIHKAAPITDMI